MMHRTIPALILLLLAFPPPPAAGHEPVGTPRNYCEDASDFDGHDYGAPATGLAMALLQDGNLFGDCNGDTVPADYDGHQEFALGGAWLMAESGDGVTGGSIACYGEVGHHPAFGPFGVNDAVFGNTVPFRIESDFVSVVPPTDPAAPNCGDFQTDESTLCVGTCSATFPPGLDGSYQVYVGDAVTGVVGTAGHVCAPSCSDAPCTTCGVPDVCQIVGCGVPDVCRIVSCAIPDRCELVECDPVPDGFPPALGDHLTPRFPPCRDPLGVVYIADDVDGFGSPAPTSPSDRLDDWMSNANMLRRGFDEVRSNRAFGHSFTGLPGDIYAASMTIRLRASSDVPWNDGISLQLSSGVSFDWSGSIDVEAASQGEPWPSTPSDPHSTATLTFDLGAAPHDLLASMSSSGLLDVFLQDDVGVDFITLEVWWCDCDQVAALVEQGTMDAFAGPEPTTPRTGLPAAPRKYDDPGRDRAFATTLRLPDYRCLREAWVTLETRVEHSLVTTDWISLQYNGNAFAYSQAAPTGPVGSVHTVTIPLAPSLVALVEQAGYLDVYVQDDSAVNWVSLTLIYG